MRAEPTRSGPTRTWRVAAVFAAAALFACDFHSAPPPPQSASQPTPDQSPYAPQPGQPPPPGSQPGTPPAPGPAPHAPPQTPSGPDPIENADLAWLRPRTHATLGALLAVLPGDRRSRVAQIPFVFDDTPGEVNAFAACIDGKSLMAITDGLLIIMARLAEAQANDELFGTRKVDEYIAYIARNQRPRAPIVEVPAGFFEPAQRGDGRRRARQADVFDEMAAFILGHELAHHYLGHLPCTAQASPLGAGEVARVLSGTVPIFNQPNEMAADVAGINNVLVAGQARSGHRWTETGALLTMRFFAGASGMSAVDILFAFELSHPPPAVREPVIRQTANTWRMTGGWLPVLSL
jgi:hypothetical protein